MTINIITHNKRAHLDLLLLADESETMIADYLDRGTLFALSYDDLRSVCVVTDEGDGICELKNLATYEKFQHQGYATALVAHICRHFAATHHTMHVGTGGKTVAFYAQCGFTVYEVLKDYFTDHYAAPIIEDGVQIFDRINLKKHL